jgi:leucyl aminopeptidase (aminopeptidase T)
MSYVLSAFGLSLLTLTLAVPTPGATQSAPDALPPVLDAATSRRIAEKIVTQSARVRPGELVVISGGQRDLPLLEDLVVAIRKAGAYSIVDYGSNRLTRRIYDEVPAALDTVPPQLRTLSITDVFIATDYLDPTTFTGMDPARLATMDKANAPFREALGKWKGRFVQLGNGLYPSPGNAERAGIAPAALGALFRAGLDVDYSALERTAESLRAALVKGKEVHLTAPNGTDFQARIAGQPVHTSDGVISDDDQRAGLGQAAAYLPAGEVYLVMVPGSATGMLVMDRSWYLNKPISGLRVHVRNGKVTQLSATSGAEGLQAMYAQSGPGKDQVGVLDIGINPAIRPPDGSHLQPWSQAGVITVGIGNDQWAGGHNTGAFNYPIQLAGATLTVDGTTLVERGALVMPVGW